MSDCRRIGAMLPAYIERELSASDAAAVQSHLDRCAVCRADSARQTRVLEPLRALRPVALPGDLRSEVLARVCAAQRPRPIGLRRLRWAGAAAAALLAAVCVGLTARRGTDRAATDFDVRQTRVRPIAEAAPSAPRAVALSGTAPSTAIRPAGVHGPAPKALVLTAPRVRAAAPRHAPAPAEFLDVADRRGVTARMLLTSARGADAEGARTASAERTGGLGALPAPVAPGQPGGSAPAEWSDRVRIGDAVTEVRGAAEWDDAGRLRNIRVSAETVAAGEAGHVSDDER